MPQQAKEKDIGDYFAPANAAILIVNVAVFLFVDLTHSSENLPWLVRCGALYGPCLTERGEYWRLLTCLFLHMGIGHLASNMLVLWFIGGTLEQLVGHARFLFLYFASGILAGIVSLGYNSLVGSNPVSVGASGAIFGAVGALAYVICSGRGREAGFSPRQILWFALLSLFIGVSNKTVGNAAHFGGFLGGLLLAAILCRRPKGGRGKASPREHKMEES